MIGGAPGHAHYEYLEMNHLEAVVVKQCSKKAESLLHRTSCDTQTEFMRKSGFASRNVGIGWEDMILRGVEDPQNPGQSEWGQILGKIECVCSLYDKLRWKWDDVDLLWSLPIIDSSSLCPPALPLNLHTPAVVPSRCTWRPWSKRVWRYTWRPESSEFGDAHGDREIDWTQRCTWRP